MAKQRLTNEREKLIRETFEHDRDIAYRTFRRLHIENPEIVQACPDPAVREQMLRGFWNQDAEKRYPEFREKVAGMSMNDLLDLRADLIDQLNFIGLMEYRGTPDRYADRASPSPEQRKDKGFDR